MKIILVLRILVQDMPVWTRFIPIENKKHNLSKNNLQANTESSKKAEDLHECFHGNPRLFYCMSCFVTLNNYSFSSSTLS